MTGKRIVQLKIAKLEGVQVREATDDDTVAEYAEHLDDLPPVVAFSDGRRYWLADGWHRRDAHELKGRKTILCEVRDGTERDAILFACGANLRHGLRPVLSDRCRAARLLLADPEWSAWSNRKIADLAGVNPQTVANYRAELSADFVKQNNSANADVSSFMTIQELKKLTPDEQKKRIAEYRRAVADYEAQAKPGSPKSRPCPRCAACPECGGTGRVG